MDRYKIFVCFYHYNVIYQIEVTKICKPECKYQSYAYEVHTKHKLENEINIILTSSMQ